MGIHNMKFLVLAVALFGAVAAEAEADADAFYGYYGYAAHPYAYGYYGYPYAYGHYAHYGKSAPCVNAANVPVPCAAGYYGKRSADAKPAADADADALYGYYGYPYGYRAYGYGYGYPYRYGYYGKRSADAEAEPQILGYPGLVGGVYAGLPGATVVAAETPAATVA